MKLITRLVLALTLTMLASTSAAQDSFLNFIDSFDETFLICGDEVEMTGFIKVFERDTAKRENFSINVVASGIGESGDIYSLTISDKINFQESDNQVFGSATLRIKVRNFDTGERYWATIKIRLASNVGAGAVFEWSSMDIDACLFG